MKVKNFTRKAVTMFMALALSLSTVACFGGDDDDSSPDLSRPTDASKTQLTIGLYDGGLGAAWARKVADEFEKEFADVSFGESGKTGVQVSIAPYGESMFGSAVLEANVKQGTVKSDVIYTSTTWNNFQNSGISVDITDTLQEDVYDENGEYVGVGGTQSMWDRMDPYFQKSYKNSNGKYYAFPFEDTVMGIIYDEAAFTGNVKKPSEMTTIQEFYAAVRGLVGQNKVPFIVYNDAGYQASISNMIAAQYEGVDQIMLNYTLGDDFMETKVATFPDGTFTEAECIAEGVQTRTLADGVTKEQYVTITPENGWMLARQQGKKEALNFLKEISYSLRTFYPESFTGNSHTEVQQLFVMSKDTPRRIAMLIDGDWWENQAKSTFNSMGADDPADAYGQRTFKMMALPTIPGQKTDKKVLYGWAGGSAAFINYKAGAAQQAAAKLWIQWMHSRSSLATFTMETGSMLPYDYDLTGVSADVDGEYDDLTPFAKSVYDLRRDDNVEIFRRSYQCDFMNSHSAAKVPGLSASFGHPNNRGALYDFYLAEGALSVDTVWNRYLKDGNAVKSTWQGIA